MSLRSTSETSDSTLISTTGVLAGKVTNSVAPATEVGNCSSILSNMPVQFTTSKEV